MMNIYKLILTAIIATAAVAVPLSTTAADAPWGAEQTVQDIPQVKVQSGAISIEIPGEASRDVVIYALTGQVVKHFQAAPGVSVVDLPNGYYIVRIGHYSVKVVVK